MDIWKLFPLRGQISKWGKNKGNTRKTLKKNVRENEDWFFVLFGCFFFVVVSFFFLFFFAPLFFVLFLFGIVFVFFSCFPFHFPTFLSLAKRLYRRP